MALLAEIDDEDENTRISLSFFSITTDTFILSLSNSIPFINCQHIIKPSVEAERIYKMLSNYFEL